MTDKDPESLVNSSQMEGWGKEVSLLHAFQGLNNKLTRN